MMGDNKQILWVVLLVSQLFAEENFFANIYDKWISYWYIHMLESVRKKTVHSFFEVTVISGKAIFFSIIYYNTRTDRYLKT